MARWSGVFAGDLTDSHRFSVWFFVVSLWWLGGGIVVLVCTIFGRENFPRFRDLFFGWRKGKSNGKMNAARTLPINTSPTRRAAARRDGIKSRERVNEVVSGDGSEASSRFRGLTESP